MANPSAADPAAHAALDQYLDQALEQSRAGVATLDAALAAAFPAIAAALDQPQAAAMPPPSTPGGQAKPKVAHLNMEVWLTDIFRRTDITPPGGRTKAKLANEIAGGTLYYADQSIICNAYLDHRITDGIRQHINSECSRLGIEPFAYDGTTPWSWEFEKIYAKAASSQERFVYMSARFREGAGLDAISKAAYFHLMNMKVANPAHIVVGDRDSPGTPTWLDPCWELGSTLASALLWKTTGPLALRRRGCSHLVPLRGDDWPNDHYHKCAILTDEKGPGAQLDKDTASVKYIHDLIRGRDVELPDSAPDGWVPPSSRCGLFSDYSTAQGKLLDVDTLTATNVEKLDDTRLRPVDGDAPASRARSATPTPKRPRQRSAPATPADKPGTPADDPSGAPTLYSRYMTFDEESLRSRKTTATTTKALHVEPSADLPREMITANLSYGKMSTMLQLADKIQSNKPEPHPFNDLDLFHRRNEHAQRLAHHFIVNSLDRVAVKDSDEYREFVELFVAFDRSVDGTDGVSTEELDAVLRYLFNIRDALKSTATTTQLASFYKDSSLPKAADDDEVLVVSVAAGVTAPTEPAAEAPAQPHPAQTSVAAPAVPASTDAPAAAAPAGTASTAAAPAAPASTTAPANPPPAGSNASPAPSAEDSGADGSDTQQATPAAGVKRAAAIDGSGSQEPKRPRMSGKADTLAGACTLTAEWTKIASSGEVHGQGLFLEALAKAPFIANGTAGVALLHSPLQGSAELALKQQLRHIISLVDNEEKKAALQACEMDAVFHNIFCLLPPLRSLSSDAFVQMLVDCSFDIREHGESDELAWDIDPQVLERLMFGCLDSSGRYCGPMFSLDDGRSVLQDRHRTLLRARGELWQYHRQYIAYRLPYKPRADQPVDAGCATPHRLNTNGEVETYGYALTTAAQELRVAAANLKLAHEELYQSEMLVAEWDDNLLVTMEPIRAIADVVTSARHSNAPTTLLANKKNVVYVQSTERSLIYDHPRLHDNVPARVSAIMPSLAQVKRIPALALSLDATAPGFRNPLGGTCAGLAPMLIAPNGTPTAYGNVWQGPERALTALRLDPAAICENHQLGVDPEQLVTLPTDAPAKSLSKRTSTSAGNVEDPANLGFAALLPKELRADVTHLETVLKGSQLSTFIGSGRSDDFIARAIGKVKDLTRLPLPTLTRLCVQMLPELKSPDANGKYTGLLHSLDEIEDGHVPHDSPYYDNKSADTFCRHGEVLKSHYENDKTTVLRKPQMWLAFYDWFRSRRAIFVALCTREKMTALKRKLEAFRGSLENYILDNIGEGPLPDEVTQRVDEPLRSRVLYYLKRLHDHRHMPK